MSTVFKSICLLSRTSDPFRSKTFRTTLKVLSAATLALLIFGSGLASAQSVTRGPYLQLATPNSVTVKWRTDVATDSVVLYGFSPNSLSTPAPP